jgi:peroxiredoxin
MAAKVLLMLLTVCLASLGYWKSQVRNDPDLQSTPADAAAIEKRVAAPDAQFTTKSGQVSKLSSFKGQVVLLTFWAHWCEPCLIELPTFRQLAGQFKDKGFVVVPVNLDTPGEADEFIANFWSNENLPFENFFDGEKKAAKLFNIDTLPANFVIDRHGRVAISSFGYNDWTDSATVDMIAQIVAEK